MKLFLLLLLSCIASSQQIINDTNSYYLNGKFKGNDLFAGTGFFIEHQSKIFLVTNYHVLTGKDPLTEELMYPLKVSPDSIQVAFKITRGTIFFKRFALYKDSTPLFLYIKSIDVAILEINIPDNLKHALYYIKEENIDTSSTIAYKMNLRAVGYPEKCTKQWGIFFACEFFADVIKCPDDSPALIGTMCLNMDVGHGGSGSPIFQINATRDKLKVIAVLSRQGEENVSSSGVYMSHVIALLK